MLRSWCRLSLVIYQVAWKTILKNSFDLLPSTIYILYTTIFSNCNRLINICFSQFSLRFRYNPKYLASSAWGILRSFRVIAGYLSTDSECCTDFVLLTFIPHFLKHLWIEAFLRFSCNRKDASMWLLWAISIAMSSAKLLLWSPEWPED